MRLLGDRVSRRTAWEIARDQSRRRVLNRRIATCVVVSVCASVVSACLDDVVTAPPAHPSLECIGDERGFNPPADIDISGPGDATADAALRTALARSIEMLGEGKVVVLSATEYGIAVDGRVVMVRRAMTNSVGDWHVTDSFYCTTDSSGIDLVLTESA